jgi:hypothetical protein
MKNNRRLKEHHGEDWNPKLLDMSLNTFLDKLKSVDRRAYDSIESIITKNKGKIIKEGNINEIGGYDDPNMYAQHAGAYLGIVKSSYNKIIEALKGIENVHSDMLDDKFRKEMEGFLTSMDEPLKKLRESLINVEKKHLGNLRGGKPTPRDLDNEE